ncbi:hypothetical protein COMA1_70152 [Candidatus Nitrospira nitrosa]|uniref:Uncharacterized protein n=1 Tax=Candidatus Nitrospira nitrosa TaxID=1742972 RepID=A0A0S4LP18_9BACT|nr:hypothetical protein [Candidatus Nitrospira nitrosa]CUS39329.1 hypothetical protein COMA1_70152 [Candidatus Nitrospira nitrosa]
MSQSIFPTGSLVKERTVRLLPVGTGAVILIAFVCIGVVLQMLGVPVTLLGLLTSDTPVESLSEDFSIPPVILEPGVPSHSRSSLESQSPRHLPIFSIAVFHPPQS